MKATLRYLLLAVFALTSLSSAAEFNQDRLLNVSSRTQVGTGLDMPVVGFVVGPGPAKNVLIRAVGPGLSSFGVSGVIADPKIDVFDGAGKLVNSNDNWTTTTIGNANAFANVGAFNLTTGSKDAALQLTLAPGAYTAQVSGVGTATGVALMEVYDVSGTAKLMNLSTRAKVGTGSGILITGITVAPGAGRRQILVRAAGPALGALGVPGALADPALAVINGAGVQIASNDNWGADSNPAALTDAFARAGAFGFAAGSKDSAAILELGEGSYSVQVSGVGGATGLALVEAYDITPETTPVVSVTATTAITDTKGASPGVYTFTRAGSVASALTVFYQVSGNAIAGVDYNTLSGSVTFPAGASTVNVQMTPKASGASDAISRSVNVAITTGIGYTIGAPSAAAVTIFYNPGTLYVASLRTTSTATSSTGYGTATIQVSGDSSFALVDLKFSNLSSPQTVAYLRIGNPGEVGTELLKLPNGQVNDAYWQFSASGALTAADIVKALKDGRIFLSVESASFPGGELRGAFLQNTASLTFTPPAAPPAVADTPLTAAEAARFLIQGTYGPTKAEIVALTGKKQADLRAWVDAQIALPASLHLDATRDDFNNFTALTAENPQYSYQNRQAAWWKIALNAPDQLRQRVAFALSQIFVTSDVPSVLYNNPLGMANYYDVMVKGAFGTYRDLLENVSLSPVMGFYLSSLRNSKATYNTAGQVLTLADENYAREVMQLFSIGLNELQPDGSLRLDPTGKPIPTYDQKTITEVAKVFTGFAFATKSSVPNFRGEAPNYLEPMILYPAFHDDTAKTIVGGVTLPPNQGGAKDLKDMLDALANHPNTAPFISRQLIQRLVTSNPSPGYIYRVSQVFANNGKGVRGDLGAVVKAILTDYEARSPDVAKSASFGKLKEPLVRAVAVLRAFEGGANFGRIQFFVAQGGESNLGQTAQHAPTVFNFYEPNFIYPGALAASGLYAPEYQILNDTTAISIPNQLWTFIYNTRSSGTTINMAETTIGIRLDSIIGLARTPQALVDEANLILAGGAVPKVVTDKIVTAITAMPAGTTTTPSTANSSDVERVRSALYLISSIPQGAIQK